MNGIDPAGFDPLAYPLDPELVRRARASIHGISHVRRVLIHAQAIAAARDIDADWFESLVLAAAWHDIGRTHDGREPEHGPNSVAKAKARTRARHGSGPADPRADVLRHASGTRCPTIWPWTTPPR